MKLGSYANCMVRFNFVLYTMVLTQTVAKINELHIRGGASAVLGSVLMRLLRGDLEERCQGQRKLVNWILHETTHIHIKIQNSVFKPVDNNRVVSDFNESPCRIM